MHDVLASLVRIAALVWKELVTMFRDPGSRKILIVPVLAQAVLFGYGATSISSTSPGPTATKAEAPSRTK